MKPSNAFKLIAGICILTAAVWLTGCGVTKTLSEPEPAELTNPVSSTETETTETNPQISISSAYPGDMPNGVLMYVGPGYIPITDTQLNTLKTSLKTNEYVICFGNRETNYAYPGKRIITTTIVNAITQSQIGSTSSTDLQKIKTELNQRITTLDGSSTITLRSLADNEISLVNRILTIDPTAKIWLAFPHSGFLTVENQFIPYYKSELVDRVKAGISATRWATNIRGFYWGNEGIPGWYTPMGTPYTVNTTRTFDPLVKNAQINAMYQMSQYVRNTLGKKFMWIPYLGTDAATQLRHNFVINQAQIFDYIVMQSYYGWKPEVWRLDAVNNSVSAQKYTNPTNNFPKWNTAKIGPELEFAKHNDTDGLINPYCESRWASYVMYFKKYRGQYPVVTYFDWAASWAPLYETVPVFFQKNSYGNPNYYFINEFYQ